MLRPLSLARLRVVLFPSEARLFPALVHGLDEIVAQISVHLGGALLERTLLLSDVLRRLLV